MSVVETVTAKEAALMLMGLTPSVAKADERVYVDTDNGLGRFVLSPTGRKGREHVYDIGHVLTVRDILVSDGGCRYNTDYIRLPSTSIVSRCLPTISVSADSLAKAREKYRDILDELHYDLKAEDGGLKVVGADA